MSRPRKWATIALAGVVSLGLLALAGVYVGAEMVLRRTYDLPLDEFELPTDTQSIAEGRRLATLRGCYEGCHGSGLGGSKFWDQPWVVRLVAPDLTRMAARHSDAELERIIRDGVRPDGRSTWGMPSASFYHLSDADLGAILAFIRSQPLGEGPSAEVEMRLLGRLAVLAGEFPPQAQIIDHETPRLGERPRSDSLAFGEYLARTVCSECHGLDLQGDARGPTPHLAMAAAYSDEEFVRLMRTGVGRGGRELGLMSQVARGRFSVMTDTELRALHAYLRSFAGRDREKPTP